MTSNQVRISFFSSFPPPPSPSPSPSSASSPKKKKKITHIGEVTTESEKQVSWQRKDSGGDQGLKALSNVGLSLSYGTAERFSILM